MAGRTADWWREEDREWTGDGPERAVDMDGALPGPFDDRAVSAGPELPPYVAAEPEHRRGPGFAAALAVVAVLALVAGTTFALGSLTRPDGADSPEAAVRVLFDALDREDALGVLTALAPSERDVIRQPVLDVVAELQRVGVLDGFPLDQVPGADVHVADLTTTARPLGDNTDLAVVDVTGGTISARLDAASAPLGAVLRDLLAASGAPPGTTPPAAGTAALADAHLHLVTLREGGGWHVSLAYTIAEGIRGGNGAPVVLGGGPAPVGSDTPDGAVRDLVTAAADLDAARVVTLLAPDESRAVYDYSPLFLPALRRSADEAGGDARPTIGHLDTRVEGDGDTRRVIVTAFDAEIVGTERSMSASAAAPATATPGTPFVGATTTETRVTTRLVWDGTCLKVTYTYEGGGGGRDHDTEQCPGRPPAAGSGFPLFSGLSSAFGSLTVPPVVVVERGGRWYVSPVRTVLDGMVTTLRRLTPGDVQGWVKALAGDQERTTHRSGETLPAMPGGGYPGAPPPYIGPDGRLVGPDGATAPVTPGTAVAVPGTAVPGTVPAPIR
jgi:hypothetical protein